jgi:hypothetical protein
MDGWNIRFDAPIFSNRHERYPIPEKTLGSQTGRPIIESVLSAAEIPFLLKQEEI